MLSPSAQGSTLLEVTIVLAILVVLAALSVPNLWTVVTSTRLRSGMSSLTGVFQNSRTLAVKQNRNKLVKVTVQDSRTVAYIDDAATPAGLTTTSPQTIMAPEFTFQNVVGPTGSCPKLTAEIMWGSSAQPVANVDTGYFNALGIPCQYAGTTCTTATGFVFYFTYKSSMDPTNPRWAAVGVSPAGRVKAWHCSSDRWGD